MKAKDLLNNLMAEKEVSVEKDGEGVVISYEGIHVSYEYEGKCVNVNRFFLSDLRSKIRKHDSRIFPFVSHQNTIT